MTQLPSRLLNLLSTNHTTITMKLTYALLAIAAITGPVSVAAEKQTNATEPTKVTKLNPGVPPIHKRYAKPIEVKLGGVEKNTPLEPFLAVMELVKKDKGAGKELPEIYKHFSPALVKVYKDWLKGMPIGKMPHYARLMDANDTIPFSYIVLANDGDTNTVVLHISFKSIKHETEVLTFTENFKKIDGKWVLCENSEQPKEYQSPKLR